MFIHKTQVFTIKYFISNKMGFFGESGRIQVAGAGVNQESAAGFRLPRSDGWNLVLWDQRWAQEEFQTAPPRVVVVPKFGAALWRGGKDYARGGGGSVAVICTERSSV